jgi:hypothetical protein
MYLCSLCWESYDHDLEYCPKKSCQGGNVVYIDDDLVPVVVELNEKGYMTQYCCSGHAGSEVVDPSTYIMFVPQIKKELFTNLPAGFKLENAKEDDPVVIRARYKASTLLRTHAKVAKGIARLALWVEKLPPLNEDLLFEEEENPS